MEHGDSLVETEDQFWEELDDIVSTPCRTNDRIDDTLRTWLEFTAQYREEFLHSEDDIARCSLTLLESDLYTKHTDYVRRQLLHCLLQEDDAPTLHLLAVFLVYDGKYHEQTFISMTQEGSFPRLVQLIRDGTDDELGLHRVLVELMYEMSRIQELAYDELATIDDEFILYLFQIVEGLSDNDNDPYNYHVIRVLLVLNEQYMVAAHDPAAAKELETKPLMNRVLKVLGDHGSAYKTFGENIIYLLNREGETSSQLLILKLLYLLFTHQPTQEYFYTNDLHVLVDILIRNILDLPADNEPAGDASSNASHPASLRHTYLRVLHPLLAYTQLRHPPHYKREQLRNALFLLADATHNHFSQPDETTVRLVGRCINVSWLRDEEDMELAIACASAPSEPPPPDSPTPSDTADSTNPAAPPPRRSRARPKPPPPRPLIPRALSGMPGLSSRPRSSKTTVSPEIEREVRAGQAIVAQKLLGMNLAEGKESQTSLVEMAGVRARPGVLAPSRARERRESSGQELEIGIGLEHGLGHENGMVKVNEEPVREAHRNAQRLVPKPPPARRGGGNKQGVGGTNGATNVEAVAVGAGQARLGIPRIEVEDGSSSGWSTGGNSEDEDSD